MLNKLEQAVIRALDVGQWCAADSPQKELLLTNLLQSANETAGMHLRLSFSMPEGYESAYGLSDPPTGTIFVNRALWPSCAPLDPLYYFLHELRHGIQTALPKLFSADFALNRRYVIQFDGTGFRMDGNKVITVHLTGDQAYFTELYLASPCELDANAFAWRCLKAAGAPAKLEALRAMWSPRFCFFPEEKADEEFRKAAHEIERLASAQEQEMTR